MRTRWMCFVVAILCWPALRGNAQDGQWRTAQPRPEGPAAQDAGAAAAVKLGRATPLEPAAAPAAFRQLVRGQIPEPPPPPPPPPGGVSVNIQSGDSEAYRCAQANRVARKGFADGTFIGDAAGAVGGFFAPANGRALFQSDHAFDAFLSPVSNPFYFEDPRALTEVKPLFIYQHIPGTNAVPNGNIWFVGLQGRVALTDRLSFVVSKLGYSWTDINLPNSTLHRNGFSDVFFGPQYTFIRSDATCTLLAGGLSFDIATSANRVLQNYGSLALRPYMSFGQNFKTGIGDFNFLNTTGVSVATDSGGRDVFFSSFHVDYDVAGWHKFYPLIELNWFNVLRRANNAENLGLVNRNEVTLAFGARYKFSECIQVGGTFEFPLTHPDYLDDYRVTFDVIFRY